MIGGAGHVLNGGEVKRLINHGSISRCLDIARLLREARQKGDEAPAYAAKESEIIGLAASDFMEYGVRRCTGRCLLC